MTTLGPSLALPCPPMPLSWPFPLGPGGTISIAKRLSLAKLEWWC